MKRIISVFLAIIMVFSLTACGGEETAENKPKTPKTKNLSANVEVGDYIKFGNYNNEEIVWLVLDKNDDRILVISNYALENRPYNTVVEDVIWETSTLRAWLNNDFINTAFSETEREMIPVTAVPNLDYYNNPCNDTEDKVFLLSIDEANEYFSSDKERICYDQNDSSCYWWLRTPGVNQGLTAVVYEHGLVYSGGSEVVNDLAVRPAMWIEIDS